MIERRGAGAVPDWCTRMSLELRRDKKKTVIFVTLVLVGSVMGGRMVVKRLGPSKASASQMVTATAKVAATPLTASAGAEGLQPGASARDKYVATIKPGISRDLFRLSPELFPLSVPKTAPVSVVKKAPTTRPALDKEAVRRKRIRAIEALVQAQARVLDLQSTILGSTPMAIINGRLLRINGKIGQFRLVAVSSRACEVEKVVDFIVDAETGAREKTPIRVVLEIKNLRPRPARAEG